jgi:dimeric dUTPase (all-alpha-NTP-PPase superfamily)
MMNSIDSARSRMTAKTAVMLEMQDRMNSRVDSDWLERGREWYRAIWIECAELMDHYGGWKWWKDSPREIDQVMLEIVDIWHFGLSTRITADRQYGSAAEKIVDEWFDLEDSNGFLRDVERLASVALRDEVFLVAIVPALLGDIGREFDDLYRAYVGKNVLNFFRQDHGYRDGSYRKTWQGREDNEHLVEILSALDIDDPDYRERVYAALQQRYAVAESPLASK